MTQNSSIIVSLHQVKFRYPGAAAWALDGVDFTLRRGEWVLLTGPTGCGKSTLLHALQGLIPCELPGELEGELKWHKDGSNTNQSLGPQFHAGLLFQNFEDQIIAETVDEELAFGLDSLGVPDAEKQERMNQALESAGLAECRGRRVAELSGGQRQRLVAASILAMRPAVLLLDEPLSQMDDAAVENFLALVDKERRERGMTVVMVEHRLHRAMDYVTRCVMMADGKIVVDDADLSEISKSEPQSVPPQFSNSDNAPPVLEVRNLSYSYGTLPVLENVCLNFRENEVVALLGPNGCGKSTLLHAVAGLLKPGAGEILWRGQSLPKAMKQQPGLVGLMLQNPDLMLIESTVRREIGADQPSCPGRFDAILPAWRDLLERPPQALSRGQRLAVALLSALTREPSVLLLDEPTTGQDWATIERMMAHLRSRNRLSIFTTHERRAAEMFADRIIWMENGQAKEFESACVARLHQ